MAKIFDKHGNKVGEIVPDGSGGGGGIGIALILILIFSFLVTVSVGGELIGIMVGSPPMLCILIAIGVIGAIVITVPAYLWEEEGIKLYLISLCIDYILLMIIWFMMMSQFEPTRSLEDLFTKILFVPIGFMIMLIVALVIAGLSYFLQRIFCICLKHLVLRWILIGAVIVVGILTIVWFSSYNGMQKILEILANILY